MRGWAEPQTVLRLYDNGRLAATQELIGVGDWNVLLMLDELWQGKVEKVVQCCLEQSAVASEAVHQAVITSTTEADAVSRILDARHPDQEWYGRE